MDAITVPCPNGGKCGSPNHRTDSAIYLECLDKSIKERTGSPSNGVAVNSGLATNPPPSTVTEDDRLETNEIRLPDEDEPSVWVGSVRAYSEGNLVGRWFAAEDAGSIDPVDVFDGSGLDFDPDDEELWVYDTSNMPVSEEMSLSDAEEWASILEDNDPDIVRAYAEATGARSVSDFSNLSDKYSGKFDDLEDYAYNFVEDNGLLRDVPEEVARYFDYESYARDLGFGVTQGDAADGGVYIFQDY